MSTRRLRRVTGLVAALLGLAVVLIGPVSAAAKPVQPDVSITETRILHVVRINCDDEAEHFSDEIDFFVAGFWQGGKTNMDGGDWWDINRAYSFEDTITVEIREWDGWTIGFSTITTADAGLGLLVTTYSGFHGTHFQYRLTYWVE
jgi:hypothetical protein